MRFSVVIGLCGRAGSGKSSVMKFLQERYGVQSISFADPLKRMAMDIWDFTEDQVFGEAEIKGTCDARWGISPRLAMQKLGSAARNHLSEHVWIDHALDQIDSGIYVIEDVRHLNEAWAISNRQGGYVIRLHCTDYAISECFQKHPSEAEVDLIPDEHIHAEILSSREKGLDHLLPLVDAVVIDIFKKEQGRLSYRSALHVCNNCNHVEVGTLKALLKNCPNCRAKDWK